MLIPIVFCADKNFILPLQVALVSLLENKKPDTYYDIYILHSDDLDVTQIELAINKYNKELHFVSMGDAYQSVNISSPIWTKTIYYRLSIHQILPDTYTKCVYCDSDVIINCDLENLFQTDINDYYLAGIRDQAICYFGYRDMFPDPSRYINAGVLLINLKKWRHIQIEKLFNMYLTKKFRFNDQDILNLVCKDNIFFWENDKYVLSGVINRRKYSKIENTIIHYCGPIKPWDIALDTPFFRLWVVYANKIFTNINELLEERRKRIDEYLKRKNIHKIIVWGMTVPTFDICYFLEELNLEIKAIGDNNEQKVKRGTGDFKMIVTDDIPCDKDDINYIVITKNFYLEIKQQLIKAGVLEEKIMSWGEFKDIIYDRWCFEDNSSFLY